MKKLMLSVLLSVPALMVSVTLLSPTPASACCRADDDEADCMAVYAQSYNACMAIRNDPVACAELAQADYDECVSHLTPPGSGNECGG